VAAAAVVYAVVAAIALSMAQLAFGNIDEIVRDTTAVVAYALGKLQLTDYPGRTLLVIGARSWQLIAVGLLSLLLLATGDVYKRKIVTICGSSFGDKRLTFDVIRSIDRQIERYLIARLAISAIVAVATGVPLWMLDLEHAGVWGLVAGVLNVLPFIGPTLAVGLIALAGFLQFQTIEMAAAAGGLATVVAALEGNLVYAVADQPRRRSQYGFGLSIGVVLGLDVGLLGAAARRAAHGSSQSSGRSYRAARVSQRVAGSVESLKSEVCQTSDFKPQTFGEDVSHSQDER